MESFKWPRILKISYKTNVFHIKVRPGEVGIATPAVLPAFEGLHFTITT